MRNCPLYHGLVSVGVSSEKRRNLLIFLGLLWIKLWICQQRGQEVRDIDYVDNSSKLVGIPQGCREKTGGKNLRGFLMLVVVDADVCLDEPDDPIFVELIEFVDPRPGGQSNLMIHLGIGGKNHLFPVIAFGDRR